MSNPLPAPVLPPSSEAPGTPAAGRMSFFDHLDELRRRLVYSALAIVICAFACFQFANQILEFLRQPLDAVMNPETPVHLVVLALTEPFVVDMKVALTAGLLICSPFLLLQIWLFISPGLYAHEKRWVVPFVVLGTLFFVGGAAFCFYLVLPASFKYLLEIVPHSVEAQYSLESYFSLILHLMLGFGLVFELPLIMAILGAAGVVSAESFVKFRKYWVVLAAVIAGVLTPTPDALTMLLMATPLWVFYELGIVGARFLRRPRPKTTTGTAPGP